MKLTKVKKLYPDDFLKKIEYSTGKQFIEDFKKTYYWEKIRASVFEEDFYIRDYPKNKPRLRFTFPLYLICILFFHLFAAIKWMFTGSYSYNEKNFFVKRMIAWDRYCRFNIV